MPTNMTTKCTMTRLHPMIHLAHVGRFESLPDGTSEDDESLPALRLDGISEGSLCLNVVIGSLNYCTTNSPV